MRKKNLYLAVIVFFICVIFVTSPGFSAPGDNTPLLDKVMDREKVAAEEKQDGEYKTDEEFMDEAKETERLRNTGYARSHEFDQVPVYKSGNDPNDY